MTNLPEAEDPSKETDPGNINDNNNVAMDSSASIGADTPRNAVSFEYPTDEFNNRDETFDSVNTNDNADTSAILDEETLLGDPFVGNSNETTARGNDANSFMLNANNNDVNSNDNNNDHDNDDDEEDEENKPIVKAFKRHSPEHIELIDLCVRKGWLGCDSALPMSKGPSADRELQIYIKKTGFTRAQVRRKFKELTRYRQALSPDSSPLDEAQAMDLVKQQVQNKIQANETKRQKQQAKKAMKDAATVDNATDLSATAFTSPQMGINDSNINYPFKRPVTDDEPQARSTKKAKHTPAPPARPFQCMLPPLDPRELSLYFPGSAPTPTTGMNRPTSPFRKLSARIASPTPWGMGPPPPQLQQFYSWMKPNPNEAVPLPPSLTRLATGDVTNLLQRPIQDSLSDTMNYSPNHLLRSQPTFGMQPQESQAYSSPNFLNPIFSVTETLGTFSPNSTPRRGNLTPGNHTSTVGGSDLSDIVNQLYPYHQQDYTSNSTAMSGSPNSTYTHHGSFPSGDLRLFSPMAGMASSFAPMGHHDEQYQLQTTTPHSMNTMNASYAALPHDQEASFMSPTDDMHRIPTAVSLSGSSRNNSSISSSTAEQIWQQQQQQGAMSPRDSNVPGWNNSSSPKNENAVPSSFSDEFFG